MKFLKGLLRHPIMLTLVLCLIGLEIYLAFIQTGTVRNERRIASQTIPAAASTHAAATATAPTSSTTHAVAPAATAPAMTVKATPAAASTHAAATVAAPTTGITRAVAPAATAPATTVKATPAAASTHAAATVAEPAASTTQTAAPAAAISKTMPKRQALLEQARKAFWSHDYKKAEADYRVLIKQYPNSPELYGELGNVLYDIGQRQAAGEQYAKAAELYFTQGHIPAARALLPIVSQLAPKQAETLQKNMIAAHAKRPAPFMPPEVKKSPVVHEQLKLLVKARQAYWHGDYQQAESDYRNLIKRDPKQPRLYGELGNVLYASGQRKAAGEQYAKAAELYFAQGNIPAARALLPIVSQLAPKRAKALQEKLISAQAKRPTLPMRRATRKPPVVAAQLELLVKARQAYWHGDYSQAVSDYRKLLEQTPDMPTLYGELGNVLLAEGKSEAAAKEYLKAGELLTAQGRIMRAAQLLPVLRRLDPAAATALANKLKNQEAPMRIRDER